MTTTIVTRSGKGSPLTNTELDANFNNLKTTADAAISSTGNNTLSGNLIVTGNLEVQGTTTSIDSTTVEITDLNITLAKDATNNTQANGAGITIAGSSAELKYVSTGDKWTLNKNLDVSGTIQDSNGTFLPSSSVSTFGGTLIDDANAAAARTTLGLGTAATSATGDFLTILGGTLTGALTVDSGISIDNITIDGDEINVGSGNLVLDVASEIHLDADSGIIRFRDDGGDIGMFRNESQDFTIRSMVSDKDMLFKGNDSGSTITALTLDMSEAGAARFSGSTSVTGSASANTSAITMGFTAPDGEIKVKNTTGAPASNLDFYTTNSSGTTAIAMRLTDEKDVSISRNLTMNGTLIGVSALGMGGAITGATSVQTDSIIEKTAANGVSIDGVTVKDGAVTSTGTITSAGSGVTNVMSFSDRGIFGTTSNHPVEIKANNSEAIRILANGKVGLGTSSPSKLLHLAESADGAKLRLTRGGVSEWDFSIGNTSTFTGVGSGALEIIAQNAGTAEQLAIGRTGIGTPYVHVTSSGVTFSGAISKGSGSFKIDHPLPAKTDTHHLVHSFVEAPQADNIYRGSVDLVDGVATVNIDTTAGMTDGTFVLLNTNVQCFTSNESGWTAIKGSVSGNTLTITAQDNSCTDTISWMVVGERHDQHMKNTDWTDSNGKVIVEPEKN